MLKTTVSRALDWVNLNMNNSERIPIISLSVSWNYDDPDLKSKIQDYIDAGGLLICSTGNDPVNNDEESNRIYPGFYGSELAGTNRIYNIITVGTLDENNNRPIYSNWGEKTIDIYAPGENILSTVPFELCSSFDELCSLIGQHQKYGYHCCSGSSMATPHVSGVAALLLSVNPELTAAQLKECILNGAELITIMVGENNDIPQTVRKLNAWGSFKYLMENYPIYECNPEYIDYTYSYNIDADASYMKDNTSMMKFNISRSGSYQFTVSSDFPIDVKLYYNDLQGIATTQIKSDENSTIEFTYNLTERIYYLRTNFINESAEGTVSINVNCPPHIHSYTEWTKYSSTKHIECCEYCGQIGTTTAFHVIKAGSAVNNRGICMYCGAIILLGSDIVPVEPFSITKVTINGSYILPNGIIVLVDEDIEAYENGTLVFYDKDSLPQTQ